MMRPATASQKQNTNHKVKKEEAKKDDMMISGKEFG
jgi:hypothetical protein